MKSRRWVSSGSFFICLTVFLVSVFCTYTTVESDQFYRTDVVVAEFIVIFLSGGAAAYILFKYITTENKDV